MSNGKEIVDLQKEIESMPEYQLELKLLSLDISRYVFKQNYLQLRQLLTTSEEPKKASELWAVKNRHLLEAFQRETIRLLHNFVASVKSLVDHTRILYRELYKPGGRFPDYQDEINKRFAQNPLAQFVEDLRDYCLHYKILPIFAERSFTSNTAEPESRIKLNVKTLSEYSSWSPPARQFLSDIKDSIDVKDLIEKYYEMVAGFHQWIQKRQMEIYADEFRRLNEKRLKLKTLVIPEIVEMALAKISNANVSPGEVFYYLLTPEEREELEIEPLTSSKHVEKLIYLIEKQAPINNDLKDKIRKIYQQFIEN